MQYDPKTDKWSSMDPMPIRRSGFAAEPLNGEIYVFGGQHEGLQALNINEILTPSKDNNTSRNQT